MKIGTKVFLNILMLIAAALGVLGTMSMLWMDKEGYLTDDKPFAETAIIAPRITEALVESRHNFKITAIDRNAASYTMIDESYRASELLHVNIVLDVNGNIPFDYDERACGRATCYHENSGIVLEQEYSDGAEVIYCNMPPRTRDVAVEMVNKYVRKNPGRFESSTARRPFSLEVDGLFYSEQEVLSAYAKEVLFAHQLISYQFTDHREDEYQLTYDYVPYVNEYGNMTVAIFVRFTNDAFTVDKELGMAKTLYDILYPLRLPVMIITPAAFLAAMVIFLVLWSRALKSLLLRIPLGIRAMLCGAGYCVLSWYAWNTRVPWLVLVWAGISLVAICLLCVFFVQFGVINRQLSSGEDRVSEKRLCIGLRQHAKYINDMGERITYAVNEQMKSERMQTELITNVSHDIKTPLTSIVNYVGLLGGEKIESENAKNYLSVLNRQAIRLKRLVEDLVEAAKAVSGTIKPNFEQVNVKELLDQATGEYIDRLENSQITAVVEAQETPITAIADGRLLWRVIDNLLSNVCKYAHPGTRVYISATQSEDRVNITVKNVSASKLNISSDELMRRFVRGDNARTFEGSGLGLSIAKSLTELQNGEFNIDIDGDLFKAIVTLQKDMRQLSSGDLPLEN